MREVQPVITSQYFFSGRAKRRLSLSLFYGSLRTVLLAVGLSLWLATPARAGMIVHVGDAQATESGGGYVDVTCDVQGGPYDLMTYMIELGVSGPTGGLRLTGFGVPANPLSPTMAVQPTPNRPLLPGTVAAGWVNFAPDSVPVTSGAGLMRAYFETDAGSAGEYHVAIDAAVLRTNFTNGETDLITDVSYTPGRIDVGVVPEPSAIVLAGTMGLIVFAAGSFRRRQRRV
jgi:hypothetical protein